MRAAQDLQAIIGFEIAKSELTYTGYTPKQFVETIIDYAEKNRFTMPFFIHADHLTVKKESEIEEVKKLINDELKAGFTSFAIDASYLPLEKNIEITIELAELIPKSLGLEVEVGEISKEKGLTTVEEAKKFVLTLVQHNVYPDLLAINNGSKHGNYQKDEKIFIDLERTNEIYREIIPYGLAGIAQHGTTGTPEEILNKFKESGIRKANVATEWQNIVHRHLPSALKKEIENWCKNKGKDIKYASVVFMDEINHLPEENVKEIESESYLVAQKFIKIFNSTGSANILFERLL